MKKTKEINYPDAMIVVETNEKIAGMQDSLDTLEQTIQRFWYDEDDE